MLNALSRDLDHVLTHAGSALESLNGSRIFVTGASGFFGCWMLESLIHAVEQRGLGTSITVLTRNADHFRAKLPHLASNRAVTILQGDVRSFDFPTGSFSQILHLAAETKTSLYQTAPLEMFETIVDGTRRVLDFAVQCQAQNVLVASSGAVYGPQPVEVDCVTEDYCGAPDPTQAGSLYGEAKRAAEMLACVYAQRFGLRVKIARCFAFTGPYMALDQHFAIGNFIADALAGRPILVQGDGTPRRSYLYAADLAAWLWRMLVDAPSGRPYNVGSSHWVSIAQLAETVSRVLNATGGVRILGTPQPGAKPQRYVPSTERARAELKLEDWIDLEESIRRTACWHLRQ
jgi:dTDP-glucose 4,6-dehydratase